MAAVICIVSHMPVRKLEHRFDGIMVRAADASLTTRDIRLGQDLKRCLKCLGIPEETTAGHKGFEPAFSPTPEGSGLCPMHNH